MQKLVMAIAIIIAMLYALTVQAIGPERDTPTAILTLEQIATPSNPASGFNRIYSKGDNKLYTLNSAGDEVELGAGGAGSGRLNLLEDPSFEDGVAEGSCSGCTASEELVEVLATVNNAKSLKMTYSAATGCYTVTKTTSAQYSPTQMAGSCFVKTSAADVTFEAMVNGVSVLSKEVSSSDSWKEYTHAFVGGATSVGYRVCANTSITDSIFVDECFLGAKDVLNKVGYDTGWNNESADFSFTGFGTPTNVEIYTKRQGSDLVVRGYFRTGTVSAAVASIVLPSKYTINPSLIPNLTSSGARVGEAEQLVSGALGTASKMILFADGVNNNNIYFSLAANNVSYVTSSGSGIYASTQGGAFEFSVPIQGWQATFDSIGDVNQNETVTKVLSANITASGTATDLTFSNLVIGAEYQANVRCMIISANGESFLNIVHDSATISSCSITDTNTGKLGASAVINFKATASTLTFVFDEASGAGVLQGDGTQSETYAQLRRIDNQINAILKDVVMSPNSSNGKPVVGSFRVSSTAIVSSEVSDFVSGNCVNSGANSGIKTCTMNYPTLNCTANSEQVDRHIKIVYSGSTVIFTSTNTAGALEGDGFTAFCHGVQL
jgi:hypothetical protein